MTKSWQIQTATEDDVWTREYVSDVLELEPIRSVPSERKLGSVRVAWEEIAPGLVTIEADGGTPLDRYFAEAMTMAELELHGYRQATIDIDMAKTATWDDIVAKAQRLVRSGNVTILRNGYNNVVGHVVGDHGAYNVEFSRQSPDSRSISMWHCECPWGSEFAWQRTRQWKKYEGRMCAHLLALLWQSQATPLDTDQLPQNFQGQPGQRGPGVNQNQMQMPGMSGPEPATPSIPYDKERSPDELSQLLQQQGLPQDQQQPAAIGTPSDQGIIPPFPGAQMEMWQEWQGPGTTPGGGQSPPWAVSVPGAKMPSPFNPTQYPGGTFSKVANMEYNEGDFVRMNADHEDPDNAQYGVWEGKSEAHGAGQYVPVPKGSQGEVRSQDPTTGWVEVVFAGPAKSNTYLEPYHLRGFFEPNVLSKLPGVRPPGVWGPRRKT